MLLLQIEWAARIRVKQVLNSLATAGATPAASKLNERNIFEPI